MPAGGSGLLSVWSLCLGDWAMCQVCGCSPCKVCGKPIENKVCSGCGKPADKCTCKPAKKK